MAECRSCGAEVVWVVTSTGKAMPVEPLPGGGGNVVLVSGDPPVARVLTKSEIDDEGFRGTHISHFATCPDAAKHRRKR